MKFIIEDTGLGMSNAQISMLFTPFSQVHKDPLRISRTSEGSSSSDLSLFISRSIARHLGGDIEVQSLVGRGTNFILTLPIQ